jgi:hypothetical protein
LYIGADLEGYSNIAEFQQKRLDELAAEREWVYDFDFHGTSVAPEKSTTTIDELRKTDRYHDVTWVHIGKLEDGSKIFIRFYEPKHPQKKQFADAVLFHWGKINDFCLVYAFPVFRPDDSDVISALFEHSGDRCVIDGLKVKYEHYEDYSDSFDIHDHGHDTISSGFTYDGEHLCLYYYDPSATTRDE